ncbi:SWI/SNF related-matrix-associated actin-dependent regulator of chromatin subfamily C protein [Dioscorea alata]|uniref:SWI/SNF related-matrix-associated actin-dependent regulator of chromatin subfamily C protein n=2 Tax=Dioscorea alata TaxID=55571 RepID=A0ACB7VBS7_DIOAL|nr:SWI/SNF related-matrix-associated actin-dependent regulator of chromatin subfamily C protein [Dioscorea alata]
MAPASPSLPSSDSRSKWKKRKRESLLKRHKPQDDDEDEEDDDEDPAVAHAADDEENDDDPAANHNHDPVLDLRESEILSDGGGVRISDFPLAVRRLVNRPHPSVLALAAADRACQSSRPWTRPVLENISHGQLQTLSAVLPDNPSLYPPSDVEKPSAYVCTPPPLMEGKGVAKQLPDGRHLLVPMHGNWFSLNTVHRLERQVVPHYFSGKSNDHTPEKYIALRNKIVLKYAEVPGKRLSFADCQGLVSNGNASEMYDLSRIVRFLDHWGIINYLTASSVHRGLRLAGSLLREDTSGELLVQTAPLKSIDSLILFDRPKASLRAEDVAVASSSSSSSLLSLDSEACDLDGRIRERLSEFSCSYCSRPLPSLHYQSQKEADVILCSDCFHDAKFITGHSSIDFLRMDSKKDSADPDGDNWTDQETFLLLEGLEKYKDNWNEIAEHVGTKSKAQCILHFIRLPMEDGLLENIEIPHVADTSLVSNGHNNAFSHTNSNGDVAGLHTQDLISANQLPFANSANPVMSLVAFLASAIGPRVAASCASASLAVLTKDDSRSGHEGMHNSQGTQANLGYQKDEDRVPNVKMEAASPLAPEHVKFAAMCGLSAAAMKAKLFADQEEREIQRLAATIITHQLKRLELKLKQFADVETLLLKECEQVERTRQRFSAERVRMMSNRFGQAGTNLPAASAGLAQSAGVSANIRHPTMPTSVGQPNISTPYASNPTMQPNIPIMQRQPMFGFGPRLPLSAIHPSSSASSQNVLLNSGMPNASNPNHHPLLRSTSGNTSNIG